MLVHKLYNSVSTLCILCHIIHVASCICCTRTIFIVVINNLFLFILGFLFIFFLLILILSLSITGLCVGRLCVIRSISICLLVLIFLRICRSYRYTVYCALYCSITKHRYNSTCYNLRRFALVANSHYTYTICMVLL